MIGTVPMAGDSEDWQNFRRIRHFSNHWARPPGVSSYYWYLTFSDSPEMQALSKRCQEAIAFSYYDPVPAGDLHLTLDRVGYRGKISDNLLKAITASASRECQGIAPLRIRIDTLSGTPGAIGFGAGPAGPIEELRNRLRIATLAAYPAAPGRNPRFHAHTAIAYCNTDGISSEEAVRSLERLPPLRPVEVAIEDVSLVLLSRGPRSYEWTTLHRIPLSGSATAPGPLRSRVADR